MNIFSKAIIDWYKAVSYTHLVDKIYNEIFKENGVIKKQLDSLDELLRAINAHVGTEEGQSKDLSLIHIWVILQ